MTLKTCISMIRRLLPKLANSLAFVALGCALVLDVSGHAYSLQKLPREVLVADNLALRLFIQGIFALSLSVVGLVTSKTKVRSVASFFALLLSVDFLVSVLAAISLH